MENDTQVPKKHSETYLNEPYKQVHSKSFRKSIKRYKRSGRKDILLITKIVDDLLYKRPLDPKYKDHNLTGDMQKFRECHIAPDLLLVYFIDESTRELNLIRVSTHSELFG